MYTVDPGNILVIRFKNNPSTPVLIKVDSVFWDLVWFNGRYTNLKTGDFFIRFPKLVFSEIDQKLTKIHNNLNYLINEY